MGLRPAGLVLAVAATVLSVSGTGTTANASTKPELLSVCRMSTAIATCAPTTVFDGTTIPLEAGDFGLGSVKASAPWSEHSAQGFIPQDDVLLDALSVHLYGVRVTPETELIVDIVGSVPEDSPIQGNLWEVPDSEQVLERIQIRGVAPGLSMLTVPSSVRPQLTAGRLYWVVLSTPTSGSFIGWLVNPADLSQSSFIARRHSEDGWDWTSHRVQTAGYRVKIAGTKWQTETSIRR